MERRLYNIFILKFQFLLLLILIMKSNTNMISGSNNDLNNTNNNNIIETGDLIFIQPDPNKYSELDDAILATGRATISWMRNNGYNNVTNEVSSHVAIGWRDINNNNELSFIQALPNSGVIKTSEEDFFHSSNPSTTTYYHASISNINMKQYKQKAADIALKQVGKPYADDFQAPPEYFYCSSLVDWAYQQASGRDEVFAPSNFTLIFVPEQWWTDYYASMTPPQILPQNVTGSNPTLVLHSPELSFKEYIP